MGNEVSKQKEAVAPPAEWDPASNAKKFELVSPMSDLSDPSMFLHRRPHPQLSDATVQQITKGKKPGRKVPPEKPPPGAEVRRNPGKARQTSAGDRRRKSKVIATRDSAYKHEPRQREMPPPSSFYFPEVPTKESEDKLNRLSLRKSTSTGGRRQSKESENNVVGKVPKNNEAHEDKENVKQDKNTPLIIKAKRKVLCFKGCFEESGHNLQLMKDNAKPEAKRGERLSSEAGTESGAGLVKETENSQNIKAFDPYKQESLPKPKPKPKSKTVLQFVDGAETELSFNPVWRESHEGTYHDASTTTDSRRNSDESNPSKLGRVSNGDTTKSSRPSAASSLGTDQENNADPNEAGSGKASSTTSEANNGSKSGDDVEGPISKRESATSVATSHESSYWNGFYKETQVLHHEDAYFGRITFAPEPMSEPSPMANTAATPIAALFQQEEKPTSLLGRNDSESVDDDDAWSVPRTKSGESSNKEAASIGAVGSKSSSNDEVLKDRKESITKASSLCQTEDQQPSDENSNTAGRTSSEAKGVMEGAFCQGFGSMSAKSEDAPTIEKSESFLDRRITADSVLVQSALVSKMSSNGPPKRHSAGTRVILQETPPSNVFRPRTSIGSAFSYKDKDVFTPVAALATYPKGSPFRPRVKNVPGAAMAKAKLDQPAMFTQSFDMTSKSSKGMEIQASESAPSMIESHDYRDIALGCFLEDTPSTTANKKMRALSLTSPGVMSLESPMPTAMSPAQSLLSNQVISNAAFLFSPSYANGHSLPAIASTCGSKDGSTELAMGKDLKKRESSSISTLESRSRTFARSKHPIRIPGSSSSYSVTSSKTTRSRKSNMSDDASHQKSVRFSDASVAASEAGSQKSRRSVTWDFSFKAAPQDVSVPGIETKVSDLSDTVFGRESLDTTDKERESLGSSKPGLRQSSIEEEITSLPSLDTSRPSRASTAGESLGLSTASGSRPSMTSTSVSQEYSAADTHSGASMGTPEQNTRTWTYCEFTKGVTPMLDKKELAQATNSPVLRFKAAKNKFGKNYEKEVPIKKKSPCSYKRHAGTGRVHLLASKFDNGGPALEPMPIPSISSMGSYASSGAGAGASKRDDKPMLRTPQIFGYTAKTHQNIYQRASLGGYPASSFEGSYCTKARAQRYSELVPEVLLNEIPDDESDDMSQKSLESTDSTFVQSVATVRQEGRGEQPTTVNVDKDGDGERFDDVLGEILGSDSRSATDQGEDLPCDEADDDFAELLLNNLLGENAPSEDDEGTVSTVPQQSSSIAIQQLRSVVSHDSEDDSTSFTNILSAPTFSDESTTMSTILAQQTQANLRQGAQTVKPHIQRQHESQAMPTSQSLFLSPVQRTPMQASKWRELADRAQKQDSKKSIFRSGKSSKKKALRTGLSERDQNVA